MAELTELPVQSWGLFQRADAPKPPPAPPPDATWRFGGATSGATAWVYYSPLNRKQLLKPVILSDGFEEGASKLDLLWDGLEEGGVYGGVVHKKEIAFITELRKRGHDLIILGYDDRSASILQNAEFAMDCIRKAIAERIGDAPLVVGGFSMGGLITRYALAKMEVLRMDHQTSTYLSYDSPHHGAWVPIALQALAHSLKRWVPKMSEQINSPASRQLLVRHIATIEPTPNPEVQPDPLRIAFLDELRRVGWWPSKVCKIGVANGSGTGIGNGVPAGVEALKCTEGVLAPTTLWTQAAQAAGGNVLVALLNNPLIVRKEVRTSGLLEFDGAPGGKLGTFGIAAHNINNLPPIPGFGPSVAVCNHPEICFVPAVSAVAIRDIDARENLYADISTLSPEESELDEFMCASENQEHTRMTKELGMWILDRLP